MWGLTLEKRRYSITRLKLNKLTGSKRLYLLDLKREDTRLRDWNTRQRQSIWAGERLDLKREDTRLRDWNIKRMVPSGTGSSFLKREDTRLRDWNDNDILVRVGLYLPWKEKILDYEIETLIALIKHNPIRILKREDTRLRDWNTVRVRVPALGRVPWKEKILDSEIETMSVIIGTLFSF